MTSTAGVGGAGGHSRAYCRRLALASKASTPTAAWISNTGSAVRSAGLPDLRPPLHCQTISPPYTWPPTGRSSIGRALPRKAGAGFDPDRLYSVPIPHPHQLRATPAGSSFPRMQPRLSPVSRRYQSEGRAFVAVWKRACVGGSLLTVKIAVPLIHLREHGYFTPCRCRGRRRWRTASVNSLPRRGWIGQPPVGLQVGPA